MVLGYFGIDLNSGLVSPKLEQFCSCKAENVGSSVDSLLFAPHADRLASYGGSTSTACFHLVALPGALLVHINTTSCGAGAGAP